MFYWRSQSGFEVDLIIQDRLAVEVKSTELVSDKHLKGLRAFKEEGLLPNYAVVSQDATLRRSHDGITIYPWSTFLKLLWSDQLLANI